MRLYRQSRGDLMPPWSAWLIVILLAVNLIRWLVGL